MGRDAQRRQSAASEPFARRLCSLADRARQTYPSKLTACSHRGFSMRRVALPALPKLPALFISDRNLAEPDRAPGRARRWTLCTLGLSLMVAASGCASGGVQGGVDAAAPELPPLLGPAGVSVERPGHSPADIVFMQGMIPHHAQALRMAALVPDRSQRREIRVLAERMAVAQGDEIELMRQWLGDRDAEVPPADATHMRMNHGGMVHDMLMPGMLTEEEFTELAAARGDDFDRLFLTRMIQHHLGAILMVDDLFASPGAAQEDFVFKFASDVYADQTTEIRHMNVMLSRIP